MDKELLEQMESLRAIGDRMADYLSVLAHSAGLSSDARAALDEWDPLSFALRRKLIDLTADAS